MTKKVLAAFTALFSFTAQSAWADEMVVGQPHDWQWRFPEAVTQIMRSITSFEHYSLWFIIPITVLVMVLLAVVVFRFRESANPTPSRTSHNTLIEVIWTVGPVVILLFLAIPSFNLLTAQYTLPEEPELTVKATGYQWYWGYEYQQGDALQFDSLMLQESERASANKEDKNIYPRLLAVDKELVVPVDTVVRVLVTGADVIHAFAMPSFGIKVDAVPGRTNETWFRAEKEGIFYGQCSEICGQNHAYMPIAIRVVSKDVFKSWIKEAASDVDTANKALRAQIETKTKLASALLPEVK